MTVSLKSIIQEKIFSQTSIAPLITFRIVFGALMMIGGIRFVLEGWIEKLYLEPAFFFKYYGFEWVQMPGETGMYALLYLIILSAAMVMLGLFYRVAILLFFMSFTYLELIDATNYLNHYYLVCLFAFLLIFLPAHRNFSLDVLLKPRLKKAKVAAWTIHVLILQLCIVYTFAGIAKLNYDWLMHAMPLAIWLPEHQDIPVLGYFFQFKETAYLFSWGGAIYDLTIAWFLLFKATRRYAYMLVIFFHLITWALFNIGLFPFIMIFSTLIFFPAEFHQKLLGYVGYSSGEGRVAVSPGKVLQPLLLVFFIVQIAMPFRHVLYSGNTMWTEEGYRFSWRVMLVEKSGYTVFHLEDPQTNRKTEIINGRYLTAFQEKQMNIQPDFILQFAHFLKEEFQNKNGIVQPKITVDAHVALNGRTSQRFIDPEINLAAIEDNLRPKPWILPFKK